MLQVQLTYWLCAKLYYTAVKAWATRTSGTTGVIWGEWWTFLWVCSNYVNLVVYIWGISCLKLHSERLTTDDFWRKVFDSTLWFVAGEAEWWTGIWVLSVDLEETSNAMCSAWEVVPNVAYSHAWLMQGHEGPFTSAVSQVVLVIVPVCSSRLYNCNTNCETYGYNADVLLP